MKYPRGTSLYDYCKCEGLTIILDQFDYHKNEPFTPKDFTKSSDKKIWFTYDPCGHSKKQRIADKVNKMSINCPICQNRGGIGLSLKKAYPKYAAFFNEKKNGIKSDEVSAQNGHEFYWLCPYCEYEWTASVADVVGRHNVCKNCSIEKRSYPEYILIFYLRKIDHDVEFDYKIKRYKYDLYSKKYNLIIEYDGFPWHNSKAAIKNDKLKDEICKEKGIKLIRLRDYRLNEYDGSAQIISYVFDEKYEYLKKFQLSLSLIIDNDALQMDIDVVRDTNKLNRFKKNLIKKECILKDIPNLKDYYDDDYENIRPEEISAKTRKIILHLRDPIFRDLKWKANVHDIWSSDLYNRKIKMCIKMYNRYPELKNQILAIKDTITELSVLDFTCIKCGKVEGLTYIQLIRDRKRELCSECLKKFRVGNLSISNRNI